MSKEELLTKENFGEYAEIDKRPLTEEEIASTKYAKFYDYPIATPTKEQLTALLPGNEIDVEQSLLPSEYGKLFHPEIELCENGYCVRPEGFGFSAIDVKFPGVKPEMFQWFTKFYTACPVNYMIWLPKFHVNASAAISDEDLGWGVMKFDKVAGPPCTLETFGIENPRETDPQFMMLVGGNISISELDGSDKDTPVKMVMINYFRNNGDGIEDRIRVWMGIHYINGEIIHENATSPVPLVDRTRMMACHNAWEWTRCAAMLPDLYQYAIEIGDVSSEQN